MRGTGARGLTRRQLLGAAATGVAATAGCLGGGSGSPGGLTLDDKPTLGARDAPAWLYYWTDFQCPYSRQFEQRTLPRLRDRLVAPGDLFVVTVAVPYLGEGSLTAAAVSRCVWRQVGDSTPAAYWAWHAAVFDHQGEKNSGWASLENLVDVAASIDGVDAAAVDDCMAENGTRMEDAVAATGEAARSEYGVRETPTFVLAHRDSGRWTEITGAQPYERFESALGSLPSE